METFLFTGKGIIYCRHIRYYLMQRLIFSVFFLFSISGFAQTPASDPNWEGFFSFNQIVDVFSTEETVYAASTNAIFTYDLLSGNISTFTTVEGLDGNLISTIYYSEARDLIILGYQNGLIQIVGADEDGVLNIIDIREQQTIPPNERGINAIFEFEERLLIATDFGVAAYDLANFEFIDSYFIGPNANRLQVFDVAVFDDKIYAATSGGLLSATLGDPFLIDFMNWSVERTGVWEDLEFFDGSLYGLTSTNSLYRLENNFFQFLFTNAFDVFEISSSLDRLSLVARDRIEVYDANLTLTETITSLNGESYVFTSASQNQGTLFIGTENDGLQEVMFNSGQMSAQLLPEGPLLNTPFALDVSQNELWVVFGEHSIFFNPYPLNTRGASNLSNGSWFNYTYEDVFEAKSISSVTISPFDPAVVYLNSMFNGIVEIVDGTPNRVINGTNSSLQSIFGNPQTEVRVAESEFDDSGSLWVLNNIQELALHEFTSDGTWNPVDVSTAIPGIDEESGPTTLVTTRLGDVLLGTVANGLVGYRPRDGSFGQLLGREGRGNLINEYVSALAEDLDGQIWIGSNLGLRRLFGSSGIFNANPADARAIVIEDENGIPRELLEDQAILDIVVDGNNNKWVATANSGAFLFSPDGQETIHRFTSRNSPLPSDEVRDIVIDGDTGLVYFATSRGLVAFRGDISSAPAENLDEVYAFPNPLRPGMPNKITINKLSQRSRVKVVDVEGNLVYEEVSQGGSIIWDTRSFGGDLVSSGVYLFLISSDDSTDTTVAKVLIIR